MKKLSLKFLFTCLILQILLLVIPITIFTQSQLNNKTNNTTTSDISNSETPFHTDGQPPALPDQKILANDYQIFQSFNNCGPASLSMALSYYGINKTQEELGHEIRPYQIPSGDNDDKSVTLDELGEKAKEYGLLSYHRPNGNIELIKRFIASGIPVITRTWLHPNEDIGHYRVVKGYDDNSNEIIQDDSFEGHNLRYSYSEFNSMWDKFNYEYLVLIPKEKNRLAETILDDDLDIKTAWRKAVEQSQKILSTSPDDVTSRFNLSVAYYNSGEYQKSVDEFEKVESKLPFRTLWYQIEPIQAYYELGNYDRVFAITDNILNNQNRAYSEAYILRGKSYQKMGQNDLAKQEFEKAVFYNQNLNAAKIALSSIN